MMTLQLHRTYHPEGTNGVLRYRGTTVCQTIELPWKNNRRGISCIPTGSYRIIRQRYPRHGDQLGLPNVPQREAILIHAANHAMDELRGCIAPVTRCTAPGKGIHSRIALDRLKTLVFPVLEAGEEVLLIITEEHAK